MLLTLFAYSLVPTILMVTVSALVTLNILRIPTKSTANQLLGLLLILSVLFTATTGAILLAQTILI